MRPVWEADWIVAPHQAKSLIERSFPQLAPVTVQSFGVGWDKAAFLANQSDPTPHKGRAIERLNSFERGVIPRDIELRLRFLIDTLPVIEQPSTKRLVQSTPSSCSTGPCH